MKNNNSVAFVDVINKIEKIEGADRIEKAVCRGWSCVIPINTYNINDRIICITPDAVIPKKLAEDLNILSYLKYKRNTEQYVVRVVKLRNIYSECLLINMNSIQRDFEIGDCVEKELGITKYEEPIKYVKEQVKKVYLKWDKWYSLRMWSSYFNYLIYSKLFAKKKLNPNPNFPKYYKFENKKNVPNLFIEEDKVIITEKIHGTNFRCGIVKRTNFTYLERFKSLLRLKVNMYTFIYGSHNVELGNGKKGVYSTNVYGQIVQTYKLDELLWKYHKDYGTEIIIYGEIYGPGIQKDYEYSSEELKLAIFDVVEEGEYMSYPNFHSFTFMFELPIAPELYQGNWSNEVVEKYTEGKSILDDKTEREGCVVKHINGNRGKIYKSISNKYKEYFYRNDLTDFH